MKTKIAGFCLFVVLILGGSGLYYSAEKLQKLEIVQQSAITPPPMSSLSPDILKIVTMGHYGLYEAFVELWLIQELFDIEEVKKHPDEALAAIKLSLRFKPRIENLYMLTCLTLGLDLGMPEECEAIILQGMELFPESFRLPQTQGFMAIFKLSDPAQGGKYYGIASKKKIAPPHFTTLAKKFEDKGKELTKEDIDEARNEFINSESGYIFKSFLDKRNEQYPLPPKELK